MKNTQCQCVSTKIGAIAIKGGIKPVFLLEFVTDSGEILIKFLNVNKTPKGNFTVSRNSDFAKLYRLTTGENPQARFSRCDKLLNHFIGYWFLVEYEQATCKRTGNYLRVTGIKPKFPVIGDSWTITGHLIKNVRARSGKIQAIFGQFLGNDDSTSGQVKSSHTEVFNPIRLFPIQDRSILNTNYDIDNNLEKEKNQNRPPPDIQDLESITEPKQIYLR